MSPLKSQKPAKGSTLAELLVCLLILAEIATFIIPKIITSSQNGTNKANTHEVASMISAAFLQAWANGVVTANTAPADLLQYMNYVSIDTSSQIDSAYSRTGSQTCSTNTPCIHLHNGGILYFYGVGIVNTFGGTGTTNHIWFSFDPDGQLTSSGTTNGPGKAIEFALFYNGRITTNASLPAVNQTSWSGGLTTDTPCPTCDPPWFSW